MLVKIYERNPSPRELQRVVEALERDGVIVYPTDSLYAFGCSVRSPRAVERLCRLKGKRDGDLSLVFDSLSQVADYCRVDNAAFRVLKRNLPGPFTFLLPASSRVPEKAMARRRTLGVRIPGHPVARAIVEALGAPLVTTSLPPEGEEGCCTDPGLIHERYGRDVALIVDGGAGELLPTTVVDLTEGEPAILREGRGILE